MKHLCVGCYEVTGRTEKASIIDITNCRCSRCGIRITSGKAHTLSDDDYEELRLLWNGVKKEFSPKELFELVSSIVKKHGKVYQQGSQMSPINVAALDETATKQEIVNLYVSEGDIDKYFR